MKKEIALLLLDEKSTIDIDKYKNELFKAVEDIYLRLLPPMIILGETFKSFKSISIPEYFSLLDSSFISEYGTVIKIKEAESLKEIKSTLNITSTDEGLLLTNNAISLPFFPEGKKIKVRYIAKAELTDNTFKITMKKKLSSNKAI